VNERWSIHFLNSYSIQYFLKWKVKFERPSKKEAPNLENEDTAILLHDTEKLVITRIFSARLFHLFLFS
jgi:hypothetical protein